MAKWDLSIELDREKRTYSPGDAVTGGVVVQAPEDTTVRRITLAREWRSRGGTISESGQREEIELSGGVRLGAGEARAFPFSFIAPGPPFSYRGRLINIEWRLVAAIEADTRVLTETPFTVTPDDAAGRAAYEWEHNRERTGKPRVYLYPGEPLLVWVIGLLGLAFTLAGGLVTARAVMAASAETVQMLAVGVIVLLFGLLGMWQVFAAARARRTAQSIALVVATPMVRPNEVLRLSLEVPSRRSRISNARLFLICEEEVVQAGKEGRMNPRRHVIRETEVARSAAPAAPGEPLRLQAVVRVPPNSPLSFHGRSTSVNWLVEARLTLPFAPDFRTRTAFVVRP